MLGILGVLGVMNGVIGDGRQRDLGVLLLPLLLLLVFPLPTYTTNHSISAPNLNLKHKEGTFNDSTRRLGCQIMDSGTKWSETLANYGPNCDG